MTTTENSAVEVRRSFSFRFVAAGAGLLCTFLMTIVAYRALDVRQAAVFFAILAALSIGPMVGRLGLGPNVIRLLPTATTRAEARSIASVHLRATLVLSLITAPFIGLVATWAMHGQPQYWPVLILTVVVVIIESMRLTLSDIFAAHGRVGMAVLTTHHVRSTLVLPAVTLLVFVFDKPSLTVVLAVYTVVAAVQLVVSLVAGRDEVSMVGPGSLRTLRDPIRHGAKLFVLDLSAFVCLPGTVWLANFVFAPHDAATYSAAATLALQVTIIESLASLAVTPVVAREWVAGNRERVVSVLAAVATLGTLVTLLIVAFLAVLGETVVSWAYGPSMSGAGVMLLILAAGGIAKTALGGNITMLIISDNIDRAAVSALVVLAIAVPAGIAAAIIGGPMALAIVSALAVTFTAIVQWLSARRVLEDTPRPGFALRSSFATFR
ncbi:lipopolysaccharide biosynthesis protein [Gordonia otitidis]|uniref:lipopolysaccharide biosynthesis protein n=1 Tax=Gordonia otitidis TaxID=249058 RepID=UPI001D1385B1|nr:lipopolysaccharide biosynthesis protein [Gordonia otitidis]UEA57843.1 lipopolysaccharide biosynthesis protein [Gordonia otitidis]